MHERFIVPISRHLVCTISKWFSSKRHVLAALSLRSERNGRWRVAIFSVTALPNNRSEERGLRVAKTGGNHLKRRLQNADNASLL
jgi:hypothetical protein